MSFDPISISEGVRRGVPPPSPSNAPSRPEKHRDWFRRLAIYFNPGDGPVDCFRAVENITTYGSYLPLSVSTLNNLESVRGGADLCGAALSFPKLFKNVSDLKKHIVQVVSNHPHASSRKIFYDVFNIPNTASQATLCLHNAKIIDLKLKLPLVNGLNQVTTIVTDGISLQDAYLDEKKDKTIRMLEIAKYASSVAIAAIVLLGIFYAALLVQCSFVIVVLSSVYVASSILSKVIEPKPHLKPVTILN